MSRFQAARSLVHSAFNSNRNENRPKKPPLGKGNRTLAEPKRKPPAHENPEQSAGRKETRMARAVVPCLFELASCAVACPRSPSERQHPRKPHTRGRPEGYSIVPGGNTNKKTGTLGVESLALRPIGPCGLAVQMPVFIVAFSDGAVGRAISPYCI